MVEYLRELQTKKPPEGVDPDEYRLSGTLLAVTQYLETTLPTVHVEGLLQPLRHKSSELLGKHGEMLRRAGLGGRPRTPVDEAEMRALALASVDILVEGGERPRKAREVVAEVLTAQGRATSAETIRQWDARWIGGQAEPHEIAELGYSPKTAKVEALQVYRQAVQSGWDPLATVQKIIAGRFQTFGIPEG